MHLILLAAGTWFAYTGQVGSMIYILFTLVSVAWFIFALRRKRDRVLTALIATALALPLFLVEIELRFNSSTTHLVSIARMETLKIQFSRMRASMLGLADDVSRKLNAVELKKPATRFILLQHILTDGSQGFVLYQDHPIAWGGSIPLLADAPPANEGESITKTEFNYYYSICRKLPLGYTLTIHRLLSMHSSALNRWLIDYDFFNIHPERGYSPATVVYLSPHDRLTTSESIPGSITALLPEGATPLVRLSVLPQNVPIRYKTLFCFLLLLPLTWIGFQLHRTHSPWRSVHAFLAVLVIHHISSRLSESVGVGQSHFALPLYSDWMNSPLDLLLIILFIIVVVACLPQLRRRPRSRFVGQSLAVLLVCATVIAVVGYQIFLHAIVENVSGSILSAPLSLSGSMRTWDQLASHYVLLIALLLSVGLLIYLTAGMLCLAYRLIGNIPRKPIIFASILVIAVSAGALIFRNISLPLYPSMLGYAFLGIGTLVNGDHWSWRRVLLYSLPALACFEFSIDHFVEKTRRELLERHTVPRIMGERLWAVRLLDSSQIQIDRYFDSLDSQDPHLAFKLWSRTELAVYGFSSSVQIIDKDGNVLNRFDLNIGPSVEKPAPAIVGAGWRMREIEDGLIAERPFETNGNLRVVRIVVQMTYENLAFLLSGNPYLAVFRVPRTEIIEENLFSGSLSLIVFDTEQRVVFNPAAIDYTLTPSNSARLEHEESGTYWTSFVSAGRRYNGLIFRNGSQICLLFYPRATAAGYVAAFVHLLLVSSFLGSLIFLFSRRARRWPGSPTYSKKVYIGVLLASLAPLLAYSVLLRSYLDQRLRTETERKGVAVAQVVRTFIEKFVAYRIDRGEPASMIFNDDLALWIQRIMQMDLHIYSGSRLLATSKRELFDSGLLPSFVDGRVVEKIAGEHAPFFVSYGNIGNMRLLSVNTPLNIPGLSEAMILSVPMSIQEKEKALEREDLGQSILLMAFVITLFTLAIAQYLALRISKPIEILVEGTSHIARGDFDYQIKAEGHDEVRTLMDSFNKMALDLRTYQEEIIKASRLKALAELARRVAHEIKNPLTPIQLSVEHVRKVYRDGNADFPKIFDQCLDNILREVDVLRKLSRDFSLFSRTDEPKWENLDLETLMKDITEPYAVGLEGKIEFRTSWNTLHRTYVLDYEKTRRALSNIFINAVQATKRGTIEWRLAEEGRSLLIQLSDTGGGIPLELRPKLFQPYFSTKDRGTGLGLAIARKDIEDQGGTINVENSTEKGTTLTIRLPVKNDSKR